MFIGGLDRSLVSVLLLTIEILELLPSDWGDLDQDAGTSCDLPITYLCTMGSKDEIPTGLMHVA